MKLILCFLFLINICNGMESSLSEKEVNNLINKQCKKMTKHIVSEDTYFVYSCKDVEFYIFKTIQLQKKDPIKYKMFVANKLTKEPYPKIKESLQSKLAESVLSQFSKVNDKDLKSKSIKTLKKKK